MTVIDLEHAMELRHLEHFLAVAEEGSFTRAAARVHLVQSALSVSIRSLERELDTRLFDRTTHRVVLTDTGQALLVEAKRTLAAAEAARDAVSAVQGGVRGTVRLGIMHSLALIDLGTLLTAYHHERPLVQLIPSFAPGGSAELVRDVVEGRLDLAFAALPSGYPPQLSVHTLASEEMMLACPPEHPLAKRRRIALAELNGERFVDFPPGWGTRLAVDQLFANAGLHREIAVEVADIPNVIDLVRAGFGFAFIGPSTVPDARRLIVRQVKPSAEFTVSMVISTERPQSAATRALADLVARTYSTARTAGSR
jgi:DNA-binding transcriptional LysR family regulator